MTKHPKTPKTPQPPDPPLPPEPLKPGTAGKKKKATGSGGTRRNAGARRKRRPPHAISEERKAAFLAELEKGRSVRSACEAAKIKRRRAYKIREANPEFALAWDSAYEAGTDLLEEEATRRAFIGVKKPIYMRVGIYSEKGKKIGEEVKRVGEETEYSDQLMQLMMRGRRPTKFSPRYELTHQGKKGGAPIAFRDVDIEGLSNEQLDQLKARLLGETEPAALLGPPAGAKPDTDR